MFLKRLTCHGFKSFADKTEFDFPRGITGIVGPNGCGKSNVVDAIKWVLGDQSARSLRGKQMMDVIFNGSGTRRSSGMAQVDLLFENADRRLNFDTDEVTITRRLFRSGESEYLINGNTVRLRDIRELFMDTGIGVGAYSIIEQGKVEVMLQANPQERRVIFEEAAGISRYKARKKEAERKLQRVNQNLLRLEDIIEEVEKRLRSIKYQAGKARHFKAYDRQLREKRATYCLAEYHRLTERHAGLERKSCAYTDQVTQLRTSIDSSETRSSMLDADLMKLEADLRRIEQQVLTTTSEMTAHRERIDQSQQRIEELFTTRSRAQQRLAAERRRADQLRRRIEEEEDSVDAIEQELDQANDTVSTLTAEDHELAKQLTTLRARVEDEKAGIIDLLRRTARMNNEIEAMIQRTQQLEDEKGRWHARHERVDAELRDLLETKARIDRRSEEIAELILAETERLEERKHRAAQLDTNRAELNQQSAAAKEYRSGLLSRKQVLVDLDHQLEGVDAGVRELLHRCEQDPEAFSYVRGMVADLISADVSNAMLIETALGEYDQYIVVNDSRALYRHADTLADFPGRVNAICLDQIPPYINGRDFSNQEGFVANAMDLVRFEPEAQALVRHLLGHTIIVGTFEDALRLAACNPPQFRYVTQSGEMLDPILGLCQLGPAGGRAGLISRKSELQNIDLQINEVDDRIAVMTERLQQTSSEITHIEQVQQQLRNAIYEARTAEVETNAARENNEAAIERLKQEQPLIAGEVESIEMQIAEAAEHRSRSTESLSRLEQDNKTHEDRVRAMEMRAAEVAHRRTRLNEQLTETRVKVGQLAQRRSMLADTIRSLKETRQASDEAVRTSTAEAEEANHRITQAERTVLTTQSRLAELFASKEQLDKDLLGTRHQRERLRVEIEQLAAHTKAHRVELEEVEEKLHTVQMKSQEVRIRVDDLLARTKEDLDIDLAEAMADYEHNEDQDWAAIETEINELKEKIRRLGNVNLDAIAEQEELEERANFLNTQHDDLRQSHKQLEELIEQLNKECRERFTETFETVRGHFQELFRKLFGGGKADVMLEQPVGGQALDVLEAGIEIFARPPGKEPQSISLLSGGEKTMTAIALLLAIFRSRPSPFAILDEVDAALDEANNERFNRIVGEFLDKSQFVIITHSKRTMTITDVLYGVTMQEAGISKRVSVKFETTEEQKSAVA